MHILKQMPSNNTSLPPYASIAYIYSPPLSQAKSPLHTIHHYAHHHFLLLCPGLRNHDGQRHQRRVLDSFPSVTEQGLVFFEKVKKYGCGDDFHAFLVGEHIDCFVALRAGQGLVVVCVQQQGPHCTFQ